MSYNITSSISSLESDFVKAKRVFNEFEDFANELGKKWNDEKKEEFYRKYIEPFIVPAQSYLYNMKSLITLLEEANDLYEI